jgi:uracil phosphoribosyltransferase
VLQSPTMAVPGELPHHYGPQVHLLDNVHLLSLLARIGSPATGPRDLPRLIRHLYHQLAGHVLAHEFPAVEARVETRMTASEPRGVYLGKLLDPRTEVVIVAVIRAGILPAEACFDAMTEVLTPERVRIDFLNMSRTVDHKGHVVGAEMAGSKIGGGVDNAILVIPDPMGATGSTVCRVLDHYRRAVRGTPSKVLSLPMIVTPEYLRRLARERPEVITYATRLDRGLSPEHVLRTEPGMHPDLERGLNEKQYIIPGAGGMGEVLTNSFC